MNKKICKKIVEHKESFIPLIFTKKQVNIIKKYLNLKKLNNTEKTYLYSTIKKKINALNILNAECYITGKNMIPERIEKAKRILKDLNKEQAFISGSFLYSKEYKDIDTYIISKKRKQYSKGKMHFIHITKTDLEQPLFASVMNYSVSNFPNPQIPVINKRNMLEENILAYELTIKEILDKENPKTIRNILLEYNLQVKNKLLDSYELHTEFKRIKNHPDKMKIINRMIKEIILKKYSPRYIYDKLVIFTKKLGKDIKSYQANENLIIYKEVFDEIKNECRKAET